MGYSYTTYAYWRSLTRENAAQWMESFKPIALKYVGPQNITVVTGSYYTVVLYQTIFIIFSHSICQAPPSSNNYLLKEDTLGGIYIALCYKNIVEGCGFSLHGGFPHGWKKEFYRGQEDKRGGYSFQPPLVCQAA